MRASTLHFALAVITAISISGCGLFGGSKSIYEDSVAGRPLEIPPGLDDPGRANSMSIPGDSGSTASAMTDTTEPTALSSTGLVDGTVPDGPTPDGPARVSIDDSVTGAFSRVGLALERAALGEIIARDEVALTYTVRGMSVKSEPVERGFFGRMFRRPATRAVEGEVVRVVRIRPDRETSEVVIEDEDGNPADDDLARRLAAAIRERLG